jgi:hypothetical protein
MEKHNQGTGNAELDFLADLARTTDRRRFLRWGGITLAVAAVGCSTEAAVAPTAVAPQKPLLDPGFPTVNLGTGDVGILNYAYALEQLEAAFYTQVVATPWIGITPAVLAIMDDIRKHEVIHRNFLRDALGVVAPAARIGELQVTFASVDFTSRTSVLTTARTFEDLGVSAYNGAGQLLVNLDYLLVAGKIVSVEARHAAVIRDLLEPGTAAFAGDDVVNAQGLDVARVPTQVLPLADPFILTNIDASGLPTAPAIPA